VSETAREASQHSPETTEPDAPDVPGHRLDAVIGVGGSAVVWSGVDATGRAVAVKVAHRGRDEVDDRQALVEQQVLMAVHHEHLVPLRSVVPLPDGREALVFDLVRGALLRGMVGSRGHLRPGEVVTVLTPICEAVAHLHAAGGVHADISPSNITLTRIGSPVLLDLGAARVAGRAPGAVHGTPGYVAPEVRLGAEPGEAADVYALGAVAWFCLTGNGAPDTMIRLDPETVVSHVGPELAGVISAAIDPEPERRPGAAELGGSSTRQSPPSRSRWWSGPTRPRPSPTGCGPRRVESPLPSYPQVAHRGDGASWPQPRWRWRCSGPRAGPWLLAMVGGPPLRRGLRRLRRRRRPRRPGPP